MSCGTKWIAWRERYIVKAIIRKEVLRSDAIAISDGKGKKISYRELGEKAEKLASHMAERSLVFILCDHQMETMELIYMTLYLNHVPLFLSADIDDKLLDNLISVYQPQYIYCSRDNKKADIYMPCHGLDLNSHVILKTSCEMCDIHPDVALLMSTSGTTGSAKLVKLSYENLYDNSEYSCRRFHMESGQRGLSPLPVNYTYGLGFCFWHWHCGATLYVTNEMAISKNFRELFIRAKINNFAATPYVYDMLKRVSFWDEETIEHLNYAMSAGSQMSEMNQIELVKLMKEKFWISYGQTECTCIISGMNFDVNNIKQRAVGRPLDNIESIIDKTTGELIIKSKSACMGYASCREHLAMGDTNRGIIRTGDVAHIDEDGCIYLHGRLTRYVKILDKRVSLEDLEQYLYNEFPDAEFACAGRDNYIVIAYTGMELDRSNAVKTLLDQSMKIPKKYITCCWMAEIPRYDTGKVNYKKIEEMADGHQE